MPTGPEWAREMIAVELSLATRSVADHVVLEIGGEIDVYTAPRLRERLIEMIAAGEKHIVVDLGWVEFLDQLCTLEPIGSIVTIDGRDITIRYAWQVVERGGHRRVFVATDAPITLANPLTGRSSLAASFVFLELRVGVNGEGEGKLSEAAQLSVDESQNVIELRDYANRPRHLVMVQSLLDE